MGEELQQIVPHLILMNKCWPKGMLHFFMTRIRHKIINKKVYLRGNAPSVKDAI